jgi:hypothetical protein
MLQSSSELALWGCAAGVLVGVLYRGGTAVGVCSDVHWFDVCGLLWALRIARLPVSSGSRVLVHCVPRVVSGGPLCVVRFVPWACPLGMLMCGRCWGPLSCAYHGVMWNHATG